MLHQITSDALSRFDASQKRDELNGLVSYARSANGSTSSYLKKKIQVFETRYEMSSTQLLVALETGIQQETADIAEWLFLLETLEIHAH